jgi:hypothetical protein
MSRGESEASFRQCGVKEIDFSDGHHLTLTFDDGTEKTLVHPDKHKQAGPYPVVGRLLQMGQFETTGHIAAVLGDDE